MPDVDVIQSVLTASQVTNPQPITGRRVVGRPAERHVSVLVAVGNEGALDDELDNEGVKEVREWFKKDWSLITECEQAAADGDDLMQVMVEECFWFRWPTVRLPFAQNAMELLRGEHLRSD